jgi:hypothetical protein
MITDFDDFCTWMFVIVDDLWQAIAPLYRKLKPASFDELVSALQAGGPMFV